MRTYSTCTLKDKEEIDMITRWANRERDELYNDVAKGLMEASEFDRELDILRNIVKKHILEVLN